MIDFESLWTSDSALENLQAVTKAFHNLMCNMPEPSLEEVLKLSSRKHFAFVCAKCGKPHAGNKAIWGTLVPLINSNTPDAGHPEHEQYATRRKEFLNQVKFIGVRDYAEPFLMASSEGMVIQEALQHQKTILDQFAATICNSEITLETSTAQSLTSYDCVIHGVSHLITNEQKNHFRSLTSGGNAPKCFTDKLSKLSQRIVLRDMSAAYNVFNNSHPNVQIDNRHWKKVTNAKKQAAKAERIAMRKAPAKKKPKEKNPNPHDFTEMKNSHYILPPHLMSEEWLVEYQICGRKVPYTHEGALAYRSKHKMRPLYVFYTCPYCSNLHYGRNMMNKFDTKMQAKSGLRWYKHNPKKANIFIHRIMMEEN